VHLLTRACSTITARQTTKSRGPRPPAGDPAGLKGRRPRRGRAPNPTQSGTLPAAGSTK